MLIKFFRRKPQEKAIIALDIGTESTKAVLFVIEEKQSMSGEVIGRRAIIKGIGKIKQKAGDAQGAVSDIATVIQNAKNAIRAASLQAGLAPEKLVMGIAGESVKGITSVLSHKREDSATKISVTELRNIVHKLQWRAFADSRKIISDETGYPEIDIKLMQSCIVDVRIDGYKVTNLLGFQGKEVQMSIFNSFAPYNHHEALQSIADELGLELLGIVSEPFALSRCIDFENTDESSALFVDIGGGVTDLAVVLNGCLLGTKMFGIGGKTFTKRLSTELNISLEEAERIKCAYTSDKLEPKSKKIISTIIAEDMEVWLDGIVLALSEFKTESLPSRLFLSGGGTYLPEIRDQLNTRKWYKKLPFQRVPAVSYLTPKDLRNIIDETKTISERSDIVPLALVNMGIDLAGEETIVQKVLRKVIGIMQV